MFFDTEDLRTNEIFLKLSKTCDAQPENKWLPAYYFDICLLNGISIGHCDLRIGHNEKHILVAISDMELTKNTVDTIMLPQLVSYCSNKQENIVWITLLSPVFLTILLLQERAK